MSVMQVNDALYYADNGRMDNTFVGPHEMSFGPIKGGDCRPKQCLSQRQRHVQMSDKVWFGLDCAQCLDG